MVLPWTVFPYSLIQDPNFSYHMLLHASQMFISSPDHSIHKYPKAHWLSPQALKMQHIYPWKHPQFVKSCPTLCNAMDCSMPGSSVHRIFPERILQWVAISFSRGPSQSRNQTPVCLLCLLHYRQILHPLSHLGRLDNSHLMDIKKLQANQNLDFIAIIA